MKSKDLDLTLWRLHMGAGQRMILWRASEWEIRWNDEPRLTIDKTDGSRDRYHLHYVIGYTLTPRRQVATHGPRTAP